MASSSVCIECGLENSLSVYKEYKPGTIQLNQCEHCGRFIDKYVEYDKVIIMLDIFLLRIESYRHMIFNYHVSSSLLWRLFFILILCQGYIDYRELDEHMYKMKEPSYGFISETCFLMSLVTSFFEISSKLLMTAYILSYFKGTHHNNKLTCNLLLRSVVISNFITFCAMVSMIWVDTFYVQFLLFFSVLAQLQVYRALVLPSVYWYEPLLMVLIQLGVIAVVNHLMLQIRRYTLVQAFFLVVSIQRS